MKGMVGIEPIRCRNLIIEVRASCGHTRMADSLAMIHLRQRVTYDIGIEEFVQVGDKWDIDSRKGKWDIDLSNLHPLPLHRFPNGSKIKGCRNLLHFSALDRLNCGFMDRGGSRIRFCPMDI